MLDYMFQIRFSFYDFHPHQFLQIYQLILKETNIFVNFSCYRLKDLQVLSISFTYTSKNISHGCRCKTPVKTALQGEDLKIFPYSGMILIKFAIFANETLK